MSSVPSQFRLQVPATLKTQLLDFRRKVWTTKMVEAASIAIFGICMAFLCVFIADRLTNTPVWMRTTAFVLALAGCMVAPVYLYHWIWRHRQLENLARLLSRKLPRIGDQLLGVIELSRSDAEQARSRTLCKAAIEQVATDAQHRNFRDATPKLRHRMWSSLAAGAMVVCLVLFAAFPAAASNAFVRFAAPWSNTPRYTFTGIQPLPETLVVPHGESFNVVARLTENTSWKPEQGTALIENHDPITAELQDGAYSFELPPQIESSSVFLSIGDWCAEVRTDPKMRPELTSVIAQVTLPEYLGRPDVQKTDVRGGSLSIVKGSRSTFVATASRPLSSAQVDGQPAKFKDATITTGEFGIDESRPIEFQWQDEFALAGKDPFKLSVNVHDDEPPTLAVENLPRQKVVLDSEQLVFQVKAHDDFGVKTVGMEWRSKEKGHVENPAKGEMPLGVGGHDQTLVELTGTFTANKLNIEPQAVELRIYAEDYFPDRKRVYSAPYTFWVLNAEQHAIWITEQLSRWHRQALDVRDRELQLYETNKQLRELSGEELDQPENRKKIENQAAAERGNSRRLANLSTSGQNLLREAARNPEISADNLEAWAQMLGILKDIAGNRMPSVADLLKQASAAPSPSTPSQAKKTGGPMAGQNRAAGGSPGKKAETDPNAPPAPVAPALVDSESSQQPPFEAKPDDGTIKKKPSGNALRFPVTTLMGKPSDKKTDNNNTPAEDKVDQALKEQKDLLAEFQKIADELNQLLANLEGSTLVKRLKAASREEYKLSSEIGKQLDDAFGLDVARLAGEKRKSFDEIGQQQLKGSQNVSYIMDDMQAYFERRQMMSLKSVLDDMRGQDVIGSLRKVADDVPKDRGLSVSQCEYWSDTLDRWAEDLVEGGAAASARGARKPACRRPSCWKC